MREEGLESQIAEKAFNSCTGLCSVGAPAWPLYPLSLTPVQPVLLAPEEFLRVAATIPTLLGFTREHCYWVSQGLVWTVVKESFLSNKH